MIRILFRVPGVTGETLSTVHSAEVHGQKSALLLNPEIEIIGFEDCREQYVPMRVKDERAFGHWIRNQCGPVHPVGVSAFWKPDDGGIPIPPNVAAEIENVFKDSERPGVVYTPGEPEIPCGGPDAVLGQEIPGAGSNGISATAMDYRELYERKEIQPAAASSHPDGYFVVDDQTAKEPSNPESEVREFTTKKLPLSVAFTDAPSMQLWLMLRANGEFVKSTTEEGGESYIACTSEQEARKVAEQQKIYDIDCVPHRVF